MWSIMSCAKIRLFSTYFTFFTYLARKIDYNSGSQTFKNIYLSKYHFTKLKYDKIRSKSWLKPGLNQDLIRSKMNINQI